MTGAPTPRRRLPVDAFAECWYVPGEAAIVDLIHPDDGLTLHFKEGAEKILARYPSARRMPFEDAWKLADAAGTARYKQDISEVDEARFTDALNVLPPVGWTTRGGVESFRISERLWGNLTDIYARKGDRYFKLVDDIRLPAAEIAARVHAFAAAHPSQAPDAPARPLNETRPSPSPSALKPGGDA